LADGVLELARGRRGATPTTILLLSGDVHFSYLARVRPRNGRTTSRIAQLVSSPLCNQLSPPLRRIARMSATWDIQVAGMVMARLAGMDPPTLRWRLEERPYFGNTNGEVTSDGRDAEALWYHCPQGGTEA